MSSSKDFTIHVTVSMIESGEWDTANVFLVSPADNGCYNAEEKGDEDIGGNISNLLAKQLMTQDVPKTTDLSILALPRLQSTVPTFLWWWDYLIFVWSVKVKRFK